MCAKKILLPRNGLLNLLRRVNPLRHAPTLPPLPGRKPVRFYAPMCTTVRFQNAPMIVLVVVLLDPPMIFSSSMIDYRASRFLCDLSAFAAAQSSGIADAGTNLHGGNNPPF